MLRVFFHDCVKLWFHNFLSSCFEVRVCYLFRSYNRDFRIVLFKACKPIVADWMKS